jgi:hypothetical protein
MRNFEVTKKMREPNNFSSNESQSTILRFTTGARDSRLFLGTPRNQIVTKINRVTRGRAASIGTPSPVSI